MVPTSYMLWRISDELLNDDNPGSAGAILLEQQRSGARATSWAAKAPSEKGEWSGGGAESMRYRRY